MERRVRAILSHGVLYTSGGMGKKCPADTAAWCMAWVHRFAQLAHLLSRSTHTDWELSTAISAGSSLALRSGLGN